MKASAISPANIAFIKYWGRLDHKLFLPLTTTNSINLSACKASTTIEFSDKYKEDSIVIIDSNGIEKPVKRIDGDKNEMLFKTLDRGREISGIDKKAQVVSKLTFPLGTGIASSAAGMSAFVAAMYKALGQESKYSDLKELSREVRLSGSVSAARSVEDGFTELLFGKTHEEAFVQKIADPGHWDLVDIIAVLDPEEKKISSSLGHEIADTSPFYKARINYLEGKPEDARNAILNRDFGMLQILSEVDTINMHAIMMTSTPPAFYFSPGSIEIIKQVYNWRDEGIKVFYTFDAGSNPHLITTKEDSIKVTKKLESVSYVKYTISNDVSEGTRFINDHLF